MVAESFPCAFGKSIVDVIEHLPQGFAAHAHHAHRPAQRDGLLALLEPHALLDGLD